MHQSQRRIAWIAPYLFPRETEELHNLCGKQRRESVSQTMSKKNTKKISLGNSNKDSTKQTVLHVPMQFNSSTKRQLIAYVHELSNVKRNRGNTKDYCTLKLQTSSEEWKDALLYSTVKRPLLLNSEQSRTAVKITGYTYTADGGKIVINDMTRISNPEQHEYSYQYAEIKEKEGDHVSILDVFNTKEEWDIIKVRGKIVTAETPRTVGSPRKRLRIMETVLADETGSVPLDLWETHIGQIEKNKTYELTKVQLRVWNARKKLSTTVDTTIKLIEDSSLQELKDHKAQESYITASVKQIHSIKKIERYLKCIACNKKIIQASASTIVECDKCSSMMRNDDCPIGVLCKLLVTVDDVQAILIAHDDVLDKLFKEQVKDMEQNMLVEKLLELKDITIKYDPVSLLCSDICEM